jgi:hypothetical protein
MTSYRPAAPGSSGTTEHRENRNGLTWATLLIRMFLVVTPAQLFGAFAGTQIARTTVRTADNLISDHVIALMMGVVAGLAVGLVFSPAAPRRKVYVAVCAAFAVGINALLLLLTTVRARMVTGLPTWSDYLPDLLVVTALQTLVAWGLWVLKDRLS